MVNPRTSLLPIEHTCKILPWGTVVSLIIGMNVLMGVMYAGIYTGLPGWAIVAAMLGLTYLLFSFITTEATFVLTPQTLERALNPNSFLFRHAPRKVYRWEDVKGFKSGSDKGRYRGEFQFLEISFRDGSTWKITDNYGALSNSYNPFLQAFLAQTEAYNERLKAGAIPTTSTGQNMRPIERRKTFYETIWAKLFLLVLGLFIAGIIVYGVQNLGATSMFKFLVVILPGFAYIYYRVFLKKDHEAPNE